MKNQVNLVGVRGGMMSNRKLSEQLSIVGKFAASHTVYTDAVIISPLEGLKTERIEGFKYPNQVKHAVKLVYRSKKGGMITTAKIKEDKLYITETNGVCKAHYNGQTIEF